MTTSDPRGAVRRLSNADRRSIDAAQAIMLDLLAPTLVHDLNSPLNNLQIAITLLQNAIDDSLDDALRARSRRYLKLLQDEVQRLSGLVMALPGFLDRACDEPQESFDLAEVVDDVFRLVRHECSARRVRREIAVAGQPLMTRGRRSEVRLALLGAAMSVVGRCAAEATLMLRAGADGAWLRAGMECSGPSQEGDSAQRPGIPLSVCRLIVEAHGGTLRGDDAGAGTPAIELSLPAAY